MNFKLFRRTGNNSAKKEKSGSPTQPDYRGKAIHDVTPACQEEPSEVYEALPVGVEQDKVSVQHGGLRETSGEESGKLAENLIYFNYLII